MKEKEEELLLHCLDRWMMYLINYVALLLLPVERNSSSSSDEDTDDKLGTSIDFGHHIRQ
jgi:hypothetical protein